MFSPFELPSDGSRLELRLIWVFRPVVLSKILPDACAVLLVVAGSGLFSVCGNTLGFSGIFFPITIPVVRCAKMFLAPWKIFLVVFCSLSVFGVC